MIVASVGRPRAPPLYRRNRGRGSGGRLLSRSGPPPTCRRCVSAALS